MKTTKFDCIAMKRVGSLKLSQQLAGMTQAEQLIFWQQGTAQLKERQRQLRLKDSP